MAYMAGGGWNTLTTSLGNTSPERDVKYFVVNDITSSLYAGNGISSDSGAVATTIVGSYAGGQNQGSMNSFFGAHSGKKTESGFNNTFVGAFSGASNITGNESTYVGSYAGNISRGSKNTFVGYSAGSLNLGQNNLFIGNRAGSTDSSKYVNNAIAMGNTSIVNGEYGVVIGHNAQSLTTGSNAIILGNNTKTSAPDSMIFGNNIVNHGSNVFLVQTSVPYSFTDGGKYTNYESDIININDKFIMGTGPSNSRFELNLDNIRFGDSNSGLRITPSNTMLYGPNVELLAPSNISINGANNISLSNSSGWISIGPETLDVNATEELALTYGESQSMLVLNSNGLYGSTQSDIYIGNNTGHLLLDDCNVSIVSTANLSVITSNDGSAAVTGMVASISNLQLLGWSNSITFYDDGDMAISSACNIYLDSGGNATLSSADSFIALDGDGISMSTGSNGVGVYISESNVNIVGWFNVQGPAHLSSDLTVRSNVSVGGTTNLEGDLYVVGTTNLESNLNVVGDTVMEGDLTVLGRVNFKNDVVMEQNLDVASNLIVSGDALINSNLRVSGESFFENNVYNGGDTWLNNLMVDGEVGGLGMSNFVYGLLSNVDFIGGEGLSNLVSLVMSSNFSNLLVQYSNLIPGGGGGGLIYGGGSNGVIEPCVAWHDPNSVFIEESLIINSNLHVGGVACFNKIQLNELTVGAVTGEGFNNTIMGLLSNGFSNMLNHYSPTNIVFGVSNHEPCVAWHDPDSVQVEHSMIINSNLHVGGIACFHKIQLSELSVSHITGLDDVINDALLGFNNFTVINVGASNISVAGSLLFQLGSNGSSNMSDSNIAPVVYDGWWKQYIEYTPESVDLVFRSKRGTIITFQDEFYPEVLNFTGKHRCSMTGNSKGDFTGMIVVSTGKYHNLQGQSVIGIDEAIPVIELCKTTKDKRVFGVVGGVERDGKFRIGNMSFQGEGMVSGARTIVQSTGEGGIWVCNWNGPIANGDYITTSPVKGLGMKQEEDYNANFTVAKITCDCDFDLNSDVYKCVEFTYRSKKYMKAFVGCIYCC